MAKNTQRAFALFAAVLFFVSTVAFSGLIIWQIYQDSKNQDPTVADIIPPEQQGDLQGAMMQDFTPIEQVDELQIIDLQEGTGPVVQQGAIVTAHYTGALAKTGAIFESSLNTQAPTFSLDEVIAGWTQGVPGMKVGGTRRLIIPAALAYGPQSPSPSIPANSDLVFDIELIDVQQ